METLALFGFGSGVVAVGGITGAGVQASTGFAGVVAAGTGEYDAAGTGGFAINLGADARTMKVTGYATVGESPDVLAFDPSLRRLYVAAESGEVTVFAETKHGLRKLGQAFLARSAHTVAVDPRTHLVYFPLEGGTTGTGSPQLLVMRPS